MGEPRFPPSLTHHVTPDVRIRDDNGDMVMSEQRFHFLRRFNQNAPENK